MQIIRKIVVGINPKDAMAYVVGGNAGVGKVVRIELDERELVLNNTRKYDVFVESDNGSFIWKSIHGLPVIVEYDCEF